MPTAQFSTKGQIVIPKAIRDRHAFIDGSTVEVVDTPAGVLLRLPKPAKHEPAANIIARFRARNTYYGAAVSIDEMSEAIDAIYTGETSNETW